MDKRMVRERGEGKGGGGGEGREGREGKSARPQGHEAITKLQKLTIKPGRHTGATIKLAGRPANRRIFLAFTTNHVATLRTPYAPSRIPLARVRADSPAERKLHSDFAAAPFEMPL